MCFYCCAVQMSIHYYHLISNVGVIQVLPFNGGDGVDVTELLMRLILPYSRVSLSPSRMQSHFNTLQKAPRSHSLDEDPVLTRPKRTHLRTQGGCFKFLHVFVFVVCVSLSFSFHGCRFMPSVHSPTPIHELAC